MRRENRTHPRDNKEIESRRLQNLWIAANWIIHRTGWGVGTKMRGVRNGSTTNHVEELGRASIWSMEEKMDSDPVCLRQGLRSPRSKKSSRSADTQWKWMTLGSRLLGAC